MDQITQLQAYLGEPVAGFLREYWMFALVLIGVIGIAVFRRSGGDGGANGEWGDGDGGGGD